MAGGGWPTRILPTYVTYLCARTLYSRHAKWERRPRFDKHLTASRRLILNVITLVILLRSILEIEFWDLSSGGEKEITRKILVIMTRAFARCNNDYYFVEISRFLFSDASELIDRYVSMFTTALFLFRYIDRKIDPQSCNRHLISLRRHKKITWRGVAPRRPKKKACYVR